MLYLSAFLKTRGYSVEIFDSTFAERSRLVERFASESGTVGIYTTLMTRRSVLEIVRAAKRHGWRVILGGPESANYTAEYLEAGADAIVIGEGELTLSELLPALARVGAHRLHDVPGIAFRDEAGAIVHTRERAKLKDLDSLPLPDREAIDHRLYLDAWKTHHGASSINLITARGCPYRCNWCSHAVYGYTHRRRSPAAVADEMQCDRRSLRSRPSLVRGRRLHDQPSLARRATRRSSSAAESTGRSRRSRAQIVCKARRPCELLRKLGCYRIWIGSESGSQKILDGMERGVTVEQVRHSTKLAQAHGIQVGMFLMWGYEGEELEDIAATVEHVKRSNPDVFLTTVSYPIKGTGYFAKVRDKVALPLAWAEGSDRDYVVAGRRGKEYYKLADRWLRNEVEASRIEAREPARAAELMSAARQAKAAMQSWGMRA